MNKNGTLSCLKANWLSYLIISGHGIYIGKQYRRILRSLDLNGKGYRWLLFVGRRRTYLLSVHEQNMIRKQIKKAKAKKEMLYLVVGFTCEPRRIIVIPAATVLKTGCIRSNKGGIDWCN